MLVSRPFKRLGKKSSTNSSSGSIVGQRGAVPRCPSIFVLFDFWSPKMNRALKLLD